MNFKEFISNSDIIINTDYDGLISGQILRDYYNCRIVGFSNSNDRLVLANGYAFNDNVVFVDMFAHGKKCLDQHILAESYPNIMNPNIERKKFAFTNYTEKYPFSTAIYVLAHALADKCPIPMKKKTYLNNDGGFYWLDYLLRADGSLRNTCKYSKNANTWWDYVIGISNNHPYIISLMELCKNVSITKIDEWEEKFGMFTKEKYGINKEGFKYINDKNKKLIENLIPNINIEQYSNIIQLHEHTCIINTMEDYQKYINDDNVFSSNFIYSPKGNKTNYSYSTYS